MSNTFGKSLRVTTFGESHGGGVGVVMDGVPPGYQIDLGAVQHSLNRRRPGQSHLASPRDEKDQVVCLSGLDRQRTLGTPLTLVVYNKDFKSGDYDDLSQVYRPSHADYTFEKKFGLSARSGGGRASARETIGRVAAAAVCEQILKATVPQLQVVAYVDEIRGVKAQVDHPERLTREEVDQTPLRCGDQKAYEILEREILQAKRNGDSVGGTICCYVKGVPVGLGDPVFDKLEATLAQAMLSLPATKGFEIGSGFAGTRLYGSEHNDAFYLDQGRVRTRTNRSGGIQGGITNGEDIYFRVAFKPVATIFKPQESVAKSGEPVTMQPKQGRHDPCVLPRAVPMVEAMTVLTLMDHFLRQQMIEAVRG